MLRVFFSFILLLFLSSQSVAGFLDSPTNKPLSPQDAFQPSIEVKDNSINLSFNIQPKYYLYKEKFKLTVNNNDNSLDFPISTTKDDPVFGRVEIYENYTTLKSNIKDTTNRFLEIELRYQGCSEEFHICYPEEMVNKTIENPLFGKIDALTKVEDKKVNIQKVEIDSDNATYISSFIKEQNALIALFIFLFLGIAMAFTPCTFPMIPIISRLILNNKNNKAFTSSLAYIIGIGLCYASIGFVIKIFDFNIQIAAQNIYILIATALVMFVLALSMFDIINIQMPSSIQTRINKKADNIGNGSLIAIMCSGFLSALVLSPCAVGPLAGTLLFASQYDGFLYPSLLLFILGLGSGIPLLLWSTSLKKFLPKTGKWMYEIKFYMGVALLLVALYMIGKIIPLSSSDTISPAILKSLYMGILASVIIRYLSFGFKDKAIMTILIVVFSFFFSNTHTVVDKEESIKKNFTHITNTNELKLDGKTLLYVGADWCVSCRQMENTTFKSPKVKESLKNFKVYYLDITTMTKEKREILDKFNLQIAPFYVLYDSKGNQYNNIYIGYLNEEKFLEMIDKIH